MLSKPNRLAKQLKKLRNIHLDRELKFIYCLKAKT